MNGKIARGLRQVAKAAVAANPSPVNNKKLRSQVAIDARTRQLYQGLKAGYMEERVQLNNLKN